MMKRLPVNLKDKQHEDLRRIAHNEKTSMSDIVREAVDEYLQNRKNTPRADTKK